MHIYIYIQGVNCVAQVSAPSAMANLFSHHDSRMAKDLGAMPMVPTKPANITLKISGACFLTMDRRFPIQELVLQMSFLCIVKN